MFNPQMTSSQMELLPLVCLCLLSWSGTTSADPPVTVSVKQGDDVILPCSINANMETGVFDWTKDGQTEVFLYVVGRHYNNGRTGQDQHFKGRVSHFEEELKHGNASIKIRNAKMADSGNYTCKFPKNHPSPTFHVQLVVGGVLKVRPNITGAAPKPYVKILDQTKNSALLQCEAHGVPDLQVEWQDSDGNILHSKEQRVTGNNRIDITLNTTVTKTGTFYCVATQKNISHRISTKITVYIEGAASEPSIKIVKTQDGVLLQCVVRGASPKPKVELKDSSGSILPAEEPQVTERGGSYDIILQAPVTKTDHYRCVVTQEEISHEIYTETYVPLNDNTGWIVAGVVIPLLVGVGLGVFYWQKQKHKTVSAELQRLNQTSEDLKKRLSASGSSDPPTEVTTLQSAAS